MPHRTRWTVFALAVALVTGLLWWLATAPELAPVPSIAATPTDSDVTAPIAAPSDAAQRVPAAAVTSLLADAASGGPTARFTGRCLVAESGAPIAGCGVKTSPDGPVLAHSGPDGMFDLTTALDPSGKAYLRIEANGRTPRWGNLDSVRAGATEALGDVRLSRGFLVTGRVVDTAGNGVTGHNVLVFGVDSALRAGQVGNSLVAGACAADGTFTFDQPLPAGDWHVQLLGSRRARGDGAFRVDADTGCAPLVIVVEDLHEITGVVVDDRGEPLHGVELTTEQGGIHATSSPDGRFRLVAEQATSGATRVLLTDPTSWSPAFVPPTVDWGQHDVRLVLPRGPEVSIQVTDDRGAPVTEFGVLFVPTARDAFPVSRNHGTHAEGKMTLPTRRLGRHVLRVLPQAQDLLASEPQLLEVGTTAPPVQRVVLERLRQVGVDVVGADGAPIGAATVELVRRGDPSQGTDGHQDPHRRLMWNANSRSNELLSSTKTGPDGLGALSAPAATNGFLLRVRAEGHEPALVLDPTFPASTPLRVVLARGGALAGHVVLHGQSRELFQIEVRDAAGKPVKLDARGKKVGPDGVFAVPLLPAGPCTVTVLRQIAASVPGMTTFRFVPFGAPITPVQIAAGETTQVEIDAPVLALGSLTGRIDGAGAVGKAPGVLLFLLGHENAARGLFAVAADGTFRADELPPGRYAVGVVGEQHTGLDSVPTMLATEVEIVAGGTHTQDFSCARRKLTVRVRAPTGAAVAGQLEVRSGPALRSVGNRAEFVFDPAPELPIEFRCVGGEWSAPTAMPLDRSEHTVDVVVTEPR